MKKINKKFSAVILMIAMLFTLVMTREVQAASTGTITMSANTSDVIVGNEITLTLKIKTSVAWIIGRANVKYDEKLFEYVSCDQAKSGGAGVVALDLDQDSSGITEQTVNIKFKAKAVGTGTFSVLTEADGYEFMFIDDNMDAITMTPNTASVKIWAQGSDDATLSSLEVAGANLNPAFAKWTTAYTVYVGTNTTSVNIAAATSQGGRTEISGNTTNLVYGNNVVTITSYAPNGKAMKYTITIVRPVPETEPPTTIPEPTTEAPEWTEVTIGNVNYNVSSDFTQEIIPAGFEAELVDFNGNDILGVSNSKNGVTLLYLVNESGEGSFFVYDSSKNEFYNYISLSFANNTYVVLPGTLAESVPDGFTEYDAVINGTDVPAYKADGDEYLYFYAVNNNGARNWYRYDTVENTVQRMDFEVSEKPTEETTTLETAGSDIDNDKLNYASENESLKDANERLISIRNIAFITCLILVVILISLIIVLITHKSAKKNEVPIPDVDYVDLEDDIIAQTAATIEEPEEKDLEEIEPEEIEPEEIEPEEVDESEVTQSTEEPQTPEKSVNNEEVTKEDMEKFRKEAEIIEEVLANGVMEALDEPDIEPEIIDLDDDSDMDDFLS